MKCLICKKDIKTFKGFASHLKKHNISCKLYYDTFYLKNKENFCLNSLCDKHTNFINMNRGYQKYCSCKCRANDISNILAVKNRFKDKDSHLKGKTYEEIYGIEKGLKLRKDKSKIRKGKKVTKEQKYKIAKTRLFKKCGIKEKNGMYGKTHTIFIKEKQKTYMINGGASHARKFLKRISSFQKKLFNLVCEVAPYVILEYPCLNKSIDIAIPKLNIAIEYDGGYYHKNLEKDLERQKTLEEEGWIFIRYCDRIPTKQEIIFDINNNWRN